MSATVRTCAYDGAVYATGDRCPQCGAQHSTADVALERIRVNQQLDVDGQLHDLAPTHERLRLFEPAPAQLTGQTHMELQHTRHEGN
jgi:hypothetical protein